ncbi:hypothetical protein BP00DRAFT_456898 [Aspergillus indologenus CBS 114.80]|uniref:Uncharacterized protein n=1 Tax=Aspergillus indologenus CBS 114.80 TaxID=1450541 RepID=A0A2V5IBY0_9EURO|nr:hypothetical protein BP00DRAFT_456898 [Aspergillus indologenus CBS 114.80]
MLIASGSRKIDPSLSWEDAAGVAFIRYEEHTLLVVHALLLPLRAISRLMASLMAVATDLVGTGTRDVAQLQAGVAARNWAFLGGMALAAAVFAAVHGGIILFDAVEMEVDEDDRVKEIYVNLIS